MLEADTGRRLSVTLEQGQSVVYVISHRILAFTMYKYVGHFGVNSHRGLLVLFKGTDYSYVSFYCEIDDRY